MRALLLLLFCGAIAGAQSTSIGLSGQYYNDATASGPLAGMPYATRTDLTINFDFSKTPAPGNLTQNFSVRWSGKVTPLYSEKYLFMTYSEGGVRLTVNGQSLIDNWTNHSGTWDWQWIDLQAGTPYS